MILKACIGVLQPIVRDDSECDVGEPSAGLSQQHIPKNAGAQLAKLIGLYSRPAPKRNTEFVGPQKKRRDDDLQGAGKDEKGEGEGNSKNQRKMRKFWSRDNLLSVSDAAVLTAPILKGQSR